MKSKIILLYGILKFHTTGGVRGGAGTPSRGNSGAMRRIGALWSAIGAKPLWNKLRAKRVNLFLVGFLVWCLLNWVPDLQHLIIGIFVCAFVAFITGDLFVTRPHVLKHPLRYWYFCVWYLPVFIWECFKANIDVAYRVLHPSLPINPGIVKVKTKLKSDTALTFLANSITLTPGTMSVDIDKDNGILYVHWINVKEKDTDRATEIIVKRFESILGKIFD